MNHSLRILMHRLSPYERKTIMADRAAFECSRAALARFDREIECALMDRFKLTQTAKIGLRCSPCRKRIERVQIK